MEQIDLKLIDEILEKHGNDKTRIISIMQEVQGVYRYLPKEALQYIAKKVGISEAKIYGVATFYGNFSLDAKGKYVLKVCRGTACHVRRSEKILEALYEAIGLSPDQESSDDGLFTIDIVHCLGACGLAPVVMVNDDVHSAMTPEKAKAMISEIREKEGMYCVQDWKRLSSLKSIRQYSKKRLKQKNARFLSAAAPAVWPAEASGFTKH